MSLKNIFLIFAISVVTFQVTIGQNEFISCTYANVTSFGYTCHLTVRNAVGLNNFTDINGTHAKNMGDKNVVRVAYTNRSSSSIIPTVLCNKFFNVKWIVLKEMGIETIDVNSLSNCSSIVDLQLSRNKISITDKENEKLIFKSKAITVLHLDSNNISSLPEYLLSEQTKMTELLLNDNKLQDLPERFFDSLKALKTLNLSQNKISVLRPEWFEILANLLNLYLQDNQIFEIPSRIFVPLKNVNRIDVSKNLIRSIHADSFGVLLKLQNFIAQSNIIYAIDERFVSNTDVNTFDMRANLCANKSITDTTASRATMRNELNSCFINFNYLTSGEFRVYGNFNLED